MKRLRFKPLLIGMIALLLIAGMVAWPVVREMRQEAKDRALIAAVKRNDADAVVRLLDEGANANAKDLPKDTRPCRRVWWDIMRHRYAKGENEAPTVLLLILHPIDESDGAYKASDLVQSTRVVRCLLEHGANPNVVDQDGQTPLRNALYGGATGATLLLIQHSANLAETGNGKLYPLLLVAVRCYADVSVVQAMLDRGAAINVQDSIGRTALICAAINWNVGMVRLLLAHHANVMIKDNQGDTVLEYVSEDSLEEKQIIRMLHQARAR